MSAVGSYAFNDYFGVMGRLGLSYVDAEEKITAGAVTFFDEDDTSTDVSYGLGVWVAPTKNFLLRLEYETTSAGLDDLADEDIDLSLISVSAVYKFGK